MIRAGAWEPVPASSARLWQRLSSVQGPPGVEKVSFGLFLASVPSSTSHAPQHHQSEPDLPHMSDTTPAATERVRASIVQLESIRSEIADLIDPADRETLERFTDIFVSRASREFIGSRTEGELGALIVGAFRFLQESRPERVDVQVLNPDKEVEGWYAPVTVIRTSVSERPFVVDTIREFLGSGGWVIERAVYPVMGVSRTPEGRLYDVQSSVEARDRESLVHMEIARVADHETLEHIRTELQRRLEDVVLATDDFDRMIERADGTITRLGAQAAELPARAHELEEAQLFVRWLRGGAFVFLGYRVYELLRDRDGPKAIRVEPGSGLGILRDDSSSGFTTPRPISDLPASVQEQVKRDSLLIISKTNSEATVHRRARMDYIGIKLLDDSGVVVGEERYIGLFTSKAFSDDAENIPILRQKLEAILDESGLSEGSHDYKEIITIFNTMPKEGLFLTPASEVGAEIETVLSVYHTHDVRVTVRDDPLRRGASLMVILPKDRFSGEVRQEIEAALLERMGGEVLNYHLALGSGDQARLHFHLSTNSERLAEAGLIEQLTERVRGIIRSWSDRVKEGLERVRPPQEAYRLAREYGSTFSKEYQAAVEPDDAVRDILQLESMRADERTEAVLLATPGSDEESDVSHLMLYRRDRKLVLSDFLPILENAGLRVIGMSPFDVAATADTLPAVIYRFRVQDPQGLPLDVEASGTLLAKTIVAVSSGDAANDPLNALTVQAGLAWRQVDVLRCYATYAFQLEAVPSRKSIPHAFRKNPNVASLLFRRFRAAFDPDGPAVSERRSEIEALRAEFRAALDDVESLADDRALRHMSTLLDATLRTNYYRHGGRAGTGRSGGVPYISLKFDSDRMRDLAAHRLMYEVWVRSSRMEGIHLRGAKVARGGIRWSDRPDDFRTEVLGLVKTQMVKNSVIVPSGSKGGFVTLRDLDDRELQAEEAEAQYKTLVRGLLDLTDNLVGGLPVPPENVVSYDETDPYLVVAADKGTAKFSDVANGVSAEYEFWLEDAFASGGSNGYDHKVVGITARGGWEGVKRHFRQSGKDIQKEPFTVVGIGDMSGDVFGNGMLLSEQIRLIAAFDHRHIFLDPDPDIERSFAERRRMFELGRSSWDDYDRDLLSPGGMIVPRNSKEITLSAEAAKALGLPEDTEPLDGESLIRALLKSPVELLWNGGIGTYVRASFETDASVGDPSNDRVRIDATQLRAQVVGEGGNLGLTQLARIEYALNGGQINTDALDNSGGVDLSDREVNLKILLAPAVADGRITQDERNSLLEGLTDEVADSVLRDNFSQSRAVSLDAVRLQDRIDDFRDLMVGLEREDILDRSAEDLPTWEHLSERLDRGQSLTRPELCVLLSYSKIHATRRILDSPLPDDASTEPYAVQYFPANAVRTVGTDGVAGHRLRREIVAGQLTNDLVDLMGATFVHKVAADTGHPPQDVIRAWLIAARLARHDEVVEFVNQNQQLSTRVVYRWLLGLTRVLERTTRWVLSHADQSESVAEVVQRNEASLKKLRRAFPDLVRGTDKELYASRVEEMVRHGATEKFAHDTITLRFLDHLLEVLVIARETECEPLEAAAAYYRVSDVVHVPWLRAQIFRVAGENRWDKRAAQALSSDLGQAHHLLTSKVMEESRELGLEAATRQLTEGQQRALKRLADLIEEIKSEGTEGLSPFSVAVREVTAIARAVR